MQKLVKKVCVVAAIIFAAVDVFAVQELETLNGMPDASNNVWRYYAAGEEGSPAADVNCVVQGDWVIGATFDALSGALGLGTSYYTGEEAKILNLLNVKVETADGVQTEVKKLTFPTGNAGWQKVKVKEIWATDAANLPVLGINKNRDDTLATTNDANIHIKRVYVKSDLVTEAMSDNFAYCYGLTNVILRCPNLVKWNERVLHFTCVTNDVSELVSPAVQSMGLWALCWWSGKQLITGSLVVTNQTGDISYESFGHVTNLYLRGDNYMGNCGNGIDNGRLLCYGNNGYLKTVTVWWPKVRKMGYGNGYNCTSVKELRFYLPSLTNMVNDTLANGHLTTSGGSLYILGPVYRSEDGSEVIDTAHLQSMMGRFVEGFEYTGSGEAAANANNSGLKRGKIYMSKKWGWKEALEKSEYFVKLSDEADTYEAKNAPEGCFGVWAGKGSGRRAYLVDYPQEGEPHGMCIRIQ
jgi:hypothetical protein